MIPLGEQHLRELLREYFAHYHAERNHQGLGNVLIEPTNHDHALTGRVLRRKRTRSGVMHAGRRRHDALAPSRCAPGRSVGSCGR